MSHEVRTKSHVSNADEWTRMSHVRTESHGTDTRAVSLSFICYRSCLMRACKLQSLRPGPNKYGASFTLLSVLTPDTCEDIVAFLQPAGSTSSSRPAVSNGRVANTSSHPEVLIASPSAPMVQESVHSWRQYHRVVAGGRTFKAAIVRCNLLLPPIPLPVAAKTFWVSMAVHSCAVASKTLGHSW
jgi:hypothetical protein